MNFDIDPREINLQGPDGMQLVKLLRGLIAAIESGGDDPEPGEDSEIFYCTYGTTTYSEIQNALAEDKVPICIRNELYYYLVNTTQNRYVFACYNPTNNYIYAVRCLTDRWDNATFMLQERLTWDYTPTQGSTRPVTSGGVWTALQNAGGSDIDPYQQYPEMDGVASPGNSDDYARGDHVHPTDTSRAAVSDIPTKLSDLQNDSGFVNQSQAAAVAPVQSVNGQTGAVTVQPATDAQVETAVDTWLGENVSQETGYALDASLTMSNAAAPADKVGDLKSALSSGMIGGDAQTVTVLNTADDVGTSAMPSTRRWFLPIEFPKGAVFGTIGYRTAASVSGTVVFELWTLKNGVLTLAKSVSSTPVARTINNVDLNYTCDGTTLLGWRPTGGTSFRFAGGTIYNLWASTDLTSESMNYSSLDKTTYTSYTPSANIEYTIRGTKYIAFCSGNVITVGDGLEYEEIQDAINSIDDDSATKPYTILVMPRGTPYKPFSTIRASFSDAYPWSGNTPRYISIVGLDKAHCVVRSDSGAYYKPCSELMLNGVVKNLSFVMTNDEQDTSAAQGGYCMHIDSRTANDIGYTMLIENCDMENASGPCMGIGGHKNCSLVVRGCRMKTTLLQSYAPYEGYRNLYDYGVVFCHTSTLADAIAQRVSFEGCIGVCTDGSKSLYMTPAGSYTPGTSDFEYTIIRNVFWNITQNSAAYSIGDTLTPNPMNFGNNS